VPGLPPRTIEVAGGLVEYTELPGDTDKAPIMLLHEGLGSLGLWRSFPAEVSLATGRRLLAYSRHGYGHSELVTGPRNIDYMHREALEVLPEVLAILDVERPVLLGHSDGASIAMIYAGSEVSSTAALILIAPHVLVEDLTVAAIEEARQAFLNTDLAERLGKHHTDPAATFWGWNDLWLSDQFRRWDIREVLPAITCPVLAIQCVDDPYGTQGQIDLIAEGVSGPVQRMILQGCGHAPHLDRPSETIQAVVTFLEGLGEGP
jgi:pimeloyl-ACP methyl ester carboxylesterase